MLSVGNMLGKCCRKVLHLMQRVCIAALVFEHRTGLHC